MVYTRPTYRTITIAASGIGSIGFNMSQSGDPYWERVTIENLTIGSISPAGSVILDRNIPLGRYQWTLTPMFKGEADKLLIDRFIATIESNPNTEFTLRDEAEYVPNIASTIHRRSVIAGSDRTVESNLYYLCEIPVFLELPDGAPKNLGSGYYEANIIATELI